MSKILIISKAFFPDISPRANRTTQLALEMVRQGNDVTVMMPEFDSKYYNEYTKNTGVKFKSLGKLKFEKINGKNFLFRALSRMLLLLFEYPNIQLTWMIKKALKNESGYDLLISIAVPHPIHWGVAAAQKKNHCIAKVWAADCGDPYMGCKTDTFEKVFYFKYVEQNWCKKCDYIIVPEASAKSGYYPKFQSKIIVISQGFNLTEFEISKYIQTKKPTFAFAGALSLHFRNPYPFLDYLCTLDLDFKCIIFNESELIKPYVEKLQGKLELRKYVPRGELLAILGTMDFLINIENNTSVQVPSKLIDYAIVNRPVLSICSELNTSIIDEFLAGNYSNQYKMPDISNYDIKNVTFKFLTLLDEVKVY